MPASAELRKSLEETFAKRFPGVEIEVTIGPCQGRDDGVVARSPLAHRMEEVAEEEIQRRRAGAVLAEGQRTCRTLSLSCLEKGPDAVFG